MKYSVLILVAMFSIIGCTYVTTAAPTTETVNGDVWYVKNKSVFSLVVAADIYYCPAPSSAPAMCQQAVIVEDAGAAPAANMNGQYGAQQPMYGQPGQPQQPGYNQPGQQQPMYNPAAQPGQPAYNPPAQPGIPAAPAAPATPAAPTAPEEAPAYGL
ncbi:MAG: hypothetical protein JXX29_23055 [Deltaproteobacteria bacterium]|nr:hypothetical protein [Deltaproteobacteria bacterium]MBN2674579.1 hypothetical protein [Deltaproteobacteria bacterium]